MSTSFEISSSTGSYSVLVRTGLFDEVLRHNSTHTLIVDEWFSTRIRAAGFDLIILPANESSKSLDAMSKLIVDLRKSGATRKTKIIAIGGGVVQDAVCFVASIYMRGVEWEYIPTTLLSMVDSCIGGKSSINVGPYKNLVGTFHPPISIKIDPALAESLPLEAKLSGLIEACKICYCRGEASFDDYLSVHPSASMSTQQVQQLVELSLAAKKWFIETDEFDQAERLLLNFGHTFGHAIESASHFRIAHGIAVGVGMLCALEFGKLMGRDYSRCLSVRQLEDHIETLLRQVPELGTELSGLHIPEVLDGFQSDKKHGSLHYSVIVVTESGKVELAKLPKNGEALAALELSIKTVLAAQIAKGAKQPAKAQ